ncbi:hypothetical protein [Nonomuraea indica]|uniref:hypothetical protein n=1 Tax=Nonomuraea indica TaxID=1581193 RepID=UPI000C7D8D85|nr:hypothetical protein [Nonomuraea indica]
MTRARLKLNTKQIKARERAGAVRGLRKAVNHLHDVSTAVAPIEESTLINSAVPSVDAANLRGAVSYDTVYAVRQHEELTWRHDPGRQAKYLEEPLNTESQTMLALVAAQIRRALR